VGGGEGFWLFSRDPTPPESLVAQLRSVAAAKGFDLTVLLKVQQAGCTYAPFPEGAASGGSVPKTPFSG
jgi:hypothetical protein